MVVFYCNPFQGHSDFNIDIGGRGDLNLQERIYGMVVFYEKHGPWKFLNCSCEFKAYQKKEEVYIYERAREGERERE